MATAPTQAAPEPLSLAAVLRIPAMRRLWYAQIISVFGDFLAVFAVISVLTFRLHSTPEQVTGVQIAYLLPIAVLGILAGVFVDRWPLKPTLVSSDLIRAALCLLLLVSTRLTHFYAALALLSIVSSFFAPAQGVAIRSVVPLHGLRSANTLMQQVVMGMRIVGPALAAFLVSSLGPRSCYWIDSASFIGSALLISSAPTLLKAGSTPNQVDTVSTTSDPRDSTAPSAPAPTSPDSTAPSATAPATQPTSALRRIVSDMQVGIRFIVHHAALLFVILALASGMFVLGCFGPLIAIYVRDTLRSTNRVFGIASGLIGVGMLVGMSLLANVAKRLRDATLVYLGLGGIALGLTLLAAIPHIWATLLGDLIIGFAVAAILIPSQTLIQQETPPALMGRVGSTVMSTILTAQIAGLVLSGILANQIGVRQVFAVCAALLVLLIAAGRLWMEPKPEGTPSL